MTINPRCEDCGLPYEDFIHDSTLPNEQWLMIHPEGYDGLLCACCMIKRAFRLDGVITMCMYIDFGEERLNFTDSSTWHLSDGDAVDPIEEQFAAKVVGR